MRRSLAAASVASVVASVSLVLTAHPVRAAAQGYDSLGTSAVAAGVSTEGTVGASGGLLLLDTGSARVTATLDSGPSAHVLAAPYEPGSTARTIVGQVNTSAGQHVAAVPDAEATYPGTTTRAALQTVPPTTAGPLILSGGAASAAAAQHAAQGSATGASLVVAGVLTVGASTSGVQLTGDAAGAQASLRASTTVHDVDVAGVLHLSAVVGTAAVDAAQDQHAATQTLRVGGATVAGQAVTIGNDGVTAVGTPVIPGQTLQQATDQANAALAQAGVAVRTVGGITTHDARSASASTGGVRITVTTPDSPIGGIAGNTLTVVVGGVALTEADTRAVARLVLGGVRVPAATGPATTPSATTVFVPGTPGTPGISPVVPPAVASAQRLSYVVAGRRLSARTALLAFAAWQLLSLGLPTLYAFVERRRRLVALGRAA